MKLRLNSSYLRKGAWLSYEPWCLYLVITLLTFYVNKGCLSRGVWPITLFSIDITCFIFLERLISSLWSFYIKIDFIYKNVNQMVITPALHECHPSSDSSSEELGILSWPLTPLLHSRRFFLCRVLCLSIERYTSLFQLLWLKKQNPWSWLMTAKAISK